MKARTGEQSATDEPVRGTGLLQWSAAAWFSAQLGSTLWMVLGGVLLCERSSILGLGPLVCFAVANLIGLGLWRARGRLAPYPALQILLAVAGVCALIALTFLTEGIDGAARYYRGLLLFPALMLYLHFLERSARRNRASAE